MPIESVTFSPSVEHGVLKCTFSATALPDEGAVVADPLDEPLDEPQPAATSTTASTTSDVCAGTALRVMRRNRESILIIAVCHTRRSIVATATALRRSEYPGTPYDASRVAAISLSARS